MHYEREKLNQKWRLYKNYFQQPNENFFPVTQEKNRCAGNENHTLQLAELNFECAVLLFTRRAMAKMTINNILKITKNIGNLLK